MTITHHDLDQFTGTESYHKFTLTRDLLTDGARFVADKAGAFWLMDLIALELRGAKYHKKDHFVVVNLKVKERAGEVTFDDGNGNVFFRKAIDYTDFPLDTLMLYAVWNEDCWIIMVPSEY